MTEPETSPPDRRPRRIASLVLLGAAGWAMPAVAGRAVLPRDLEIEVAYRGAPGPVGLLEDISGAAVRAIADKGCFREVRAVRVGTPPGQAVRCRVLVEKVGEETLHDISLARREAALDPGDVLMVTAVMEADVRLEILAPGGSVPLRSRRFHVEERVRPRALDEDARDTARSSAVEAVARRACEFACRLRPRDLAETPRAGSR